LERREREREREKRESDFHYKIRNKYDRPRAFYEDILLLVL
jgi:hypothetical protein